MVYQVVTVPGEAVGPARLALQEVLLLYKVLQVLIVSNHYKRAATTQFRVPLGYISDNS
jgi:hypothetical protein